jgi:hypothetical protein
MRCCVMTRMVTKLGRNGRPATFLHTMSCRERSAPWFAKTYGYEVLIRDSDLAPLETPEPPPNVQSNPVRYEGPPDYGEAE